MGVRVAPGGLHAVPHILTILARDVTTRISSFAGMKTLVTSHVHTASCGMCMCERMRARRGEGGEGGEVDKRANAIGALSWWHPPSKGECVEDVKGAGLRDDLGFPRSLSL